MRVTVYKLLVSLSLAMACCGTFAQANVSSASQCGTQLNACLKIQNNPRIFCGMAAQTAIKNCFIELEGPVVGACNYGMTIGMGWNSKCNTTSNSFPTCMARGETAQGNCYANFGNSNPENSPCNLEFQTCLQNVDSVPFRPR